MKNQMVNLLKISGFAVVVASTASAAYGQAQPRAASPRPTTTTNAPQLNTVDGRAAQVTVRSAVNEFGVRAGLNEKQVSALYRDVSIKLADREAALSKTGSKMTSEIARAVFMDVVSNVTVKNANKAAVSEMGSASFALALQTSSTADVAQEVINKQVAAITADQANVKCDLLTSTEEGRKAADGLMSRDADLATISTMQGLQTVIAKNASIIQGAFSSWNTLNVETFALVNGKPVSYKVTGPVEAANKWFAGSNKSESSIDVAQGYIGVQQVIIDTKNGIGKSADQDTLWSLSMGELVNRLTPIVGAEGANSIVYGQLVDASNPNAKVHDANKDGVINEDDGLVRGDFDPATGKVVASGIAGKCRKGPFGF